ncbi:MULTISPECIES: nucleotidyltransferase family protein [unclassified Thioalkalivibrio]|uniref:nucleotidyltransferase family protein n=1 Tax=unclassified Thioalkalivibrio TaxID=2621013 RepID=UPI00056F3A46|nr:MULTISPECIES: nucleotidyltransferase family protein [unclassified Thioalkalivibrio]
MQPSKAVEKHRDAIRRVVERHHANNARVFGSVLRGQDTPDSDLDLLVDPTEETSLLDIGAIRVELTELLGVEVDVVTPGALPEKWRSQVLETARVI